jgi:hypothetical protein
MKELLAGKKPPGAEEGKETGGWERQSASQVEKIRSQISRSPRKLLP